MVPQKHPHSEQRSVALTIPELEQSKAAVLNTLASVHSRRSYAFAIDRFVSWYCSEPRLTFNRAIVVRYRSYLESLGLSAATINLRLSAIRRLADESAESGWLTPEVAIGIRRVQGVKRLGRRSGNWLTRNQAQELVTPRRKQTCAVGGMARFSGCFWGVVCDVRKSWDGPWISCKPGKAGGSS